MSINPFNGKNPISYQTRKAKRWLIICVITLTSITLSLLITYAVLYLTGSPMMPVIFFIATLAPLIISPITSWVISGLVLKMHEMEAIHRYQASHDGLTGLLTRESFISQCDQLIERCQQHNQPCSLSYIDLDRFKAINDTYGHAGGDEVLRHFAKTMKKVMRKTDTAGRLGGEEFAIFFPDASLEDSKLILDRLRQEIEHSEVNYHAEVIQYTLSAGLTTAKPPSETTENSTADHFETMAKKADSALYQAKDSGRNAIICVI